MKYFLTLLILFQCFLTHTYAQTTAFFTPIHQYPIPIIDGETITTIFKNEDKTDPCQYIFVIAMASDNGFISLKPVYLLCKQDDKKEYKRILASIFDDKGAAGSAKGETGFLTGDKIAERLTKKEAEQYIENYYIKYKVAILKKTRFKIEYDIIQEPKQKIMNIYQ